jgi:hypothetical protein
VFECCGTFRRLHLESRGKSVAQRGCYARVFSYLLKIKMCSLFVNF